jgi:hypothetical protein
LPKHVVPQFFGVGTHGGQGGELVGEDLVCMGSLVVFERAPIGDDDIMVVAVLESVRDPSFETKPENLNTCPATNPPLSPP